MLGDAHRLDRDESGTAQLVIVSYVWTTPVWNRALGVGRETY